MERYFDFQGQQPNQYSWDNYRVMIYGRSYCVSPIDSDPFECIRFEIYEDSDELYCIFYFTYQMDDTYCGSSVGNIGSNYSALLREAINNSGIRCTLPENYDIEDALGELLMNFEPDANIIMTNLAGELRIKEGIN